MIPHELKCCGRAIPNQDPSVIPPGMESVTLNVKLPILMKIWRLIESYTGFRWKATSFLRSQNAPSHNGNALDIAPEFDQQSESKYSLASMSDPVLYKRAPLMRSLQRISADIRNDSPFTIGIFVEPDHIHIGIFKRQTGEDPRIQVFKWGVTKEIYHDTVERSKLPLMYG